MTKHVVFTAKVEQPRSSRSLCREKNPSEGHLILQVLYTLLVNKTREQHNEGVEKETKSRQRSSSWPNTEPGEAAH